MKEGFNSFYGTKAILYIFALICQSLGKNLQIFGQEKITAKLLSICINHRVYAGICNRTNDDIISMFIRRFK